MIRAILWSAAAMLSGCIGNDVPHPTIKAAFTSFEVEGALHESEIDEMRRTVTVTLAEQTDRQKVVPVSIEYTPTATSSLLFDRAIDMSQTINVTLTTNRDYEWRIVAEQPVARLFEIDNQVGEAVVDVVNRQVVAMVSKSNKLSDIHIRELKLGPAELTTISPAKEQITDFTSGCQTVSVSYRNTTEEWRLYVSQSTSSVEIKSVDPFAMFAWVNVSTSSAQNSGIMYRKHGTSEWTKIQGSEAQQNGGVLRFKIGSLTPVTAYECYAYNGSDKSSTESFTTQSTVVLQNGGFETWSNCDSKKYMSPYLTDETKWWDTGNKGSAIAGEVIAQPDSQTKVQGNYSAELTTRFASVIGIGKLAAGNIFTGEFAGIVGTRGGKVNFGRPFTARPTSLKGSVKYNCGVIDRVEENPMGIKKGDMDRGQIYIALGDWDYKNFGGTADCPVQVNTTDKSTLFNPESKSVIAYGALSWQRSIDDWITFEIPLTYRSSRQPTHIIICCSPSSYGDYFTGSTQSVMWVDNLTLGWE